MKSFRIETDVRPPRRWLSVRVYDSVESLRIAAERYAGGPRGEFKNAVACVQGFRPRFLVGPDGSVSGAPDWPRNGFAGVVRFAAEQMWTETIHHELVHAAAVVYRMNVAQDIQLGDAFTDMTNEESFAYILGELGADMDKALREHFDFGSGGG